MTHPLLSRRQFIGATAAALLAPKFASAASASEPIIDIHQHTNYGGPRDEAFKVLGLGRNHEELAAHQRLMGVTTTILLPAGRPVERASTHQGRANGLQGTCTTNDDCMALAQMRPKEFFFGANEVSDLADAPQVIEKYLKLGAVVIGEQKFGVECDSPEMQQLYRLAEAYNVPILMHWQAGSYNFGLERFHKMLTKYPKTNFIGHAQTWWASIDRAYQSNPTNLSPKGAVTPGGITDRYLSDYPNMYGDMSAGSGRNAMGRDPEHARAFFQRHQDKLLFGSDCTDKLAEGTACIGANQIAQIKKFSPSKAVERKLLYENAKKLFRLKGIA
jgi:predicted TIM-barrel fold metal-dependent hydrolase